MKSYKNSKTGASLSKVSTDELLESLNVKSVKNPHAFFEPNGAIESFIKLVGSDNVFICLLSAANGVGKTAAGVNILSHIIYGPSGNPYFDDLPLFKKFPYPSKRGRIVSDHTTVESVIDPELKKWFPRGRYITKKKGRNYDYYWRTDTGFEFELMTYDQDLGEFESATLGWAWFDEPPPLAIYKATVARMRRGGIIFITATPLMGSAWMYDHILAYKSEENEEDRGDTRQRAYIEADIEENCKEHGIRGLLNHSDIQKMIKEYDEEDLQARVKGKFHHLIGLVFKNFNRKVHVIKPFTIKRKDWLVYEALDPHPRNPDAVMWVAVNKNGTKIVVDELYDKLITKELAANIQTKADRFRIQERWADPSAFLEDKHQPNPAEHTLAYKLAELGLSYQKATKDRTAADRRIKDSLDYEIVGDEMLLAPDILIFSTCTRTIWELEHYRWAEWLGKAAERKDPKETPMDKDDHMIENLGRILGQNPVFIPMPRPEKVRTTGKSIKESDVYD